MNPPQPGRRFNWVVLLFPPDKGALIKITLLPFPSLPPASSPFHLPLIPLHLNFMSRPSVSSRASWLPSGLRFREHKTLLPLLLCSPSNLFSRRVLCVKWNELEMVGQEIKGRLEDGMRDGGGSCGGSDTSMACF